MLRNTNQYMSNVLDFSQVLENFGIDPSLKTIGGRNLSQLQTRPAAVGATTTSAPTSTNGSQQGKNLPTVISNAMNRQGQRSERQAQQQQQQQPTQPQHTPTFVPQSSPQVQAQPILAMANKSVQMCSTCGKYAGECQCPPNEVVLQGQSVNDGSSNCRQPKILMSFYGFNQLRAPGRVVPFTVSQINQFMIVLSPLASNPTGLNKALGFGTTVFYPTLVSLNFDPAGPLAMYSKRWVVMPPGSSTTSIPTGSYVLLSYNDSECDCDCAPAVNDFVYIMSGATPGIYRILTLDPCTGIWTLEYTFLLGFEIACIVHFTACGTEFLFEEDCFCVPDVPVSIVTPVTNPPSIAAF